MALLTVLARQSSVGGRPGHCRSLGSIPASTHQMPVAPLAKVVVAKNVCRHCQMSPGGGGGERVGAESPPGENHWFRVTCLKLGNCFGSLCFCLIGPWQRVGKAAFLDSGVINRLKGTQIAINTGALPWEHSSACVANTLETKLEVKSPKSGHRLSGT